ncbi:hypothetical protein AURDEDRAFT_123949 [Auricularia subglabra TFB-10046 SS5]|nr:hypothetical protein AURDEDRAFT_123949 [Auricularia subglabra TFB-10046 SS5]
MHEDPGDHCIVGPEPTGLAGTEDRLSGPHLSFIHVSMAFTTIALILALVLGSMGGMNITIDDNDPRILYSPDRRWVQGFQEQSSQPPYLPALEWQHVYNHSLDGPAEIVLFINGSQAVPLSFDLRVPMVPEGDYAYNVPVVLKTQMRHGHHQVRVQTHANPTNRTWALFDYAVYTGSLPPSHSTETIELAQEPVKSGMPAAMRTAIISSTISAAVLIMGVALWCIWWRGKRTLPPDDDSGEPGPEPYSIDSPGSEETTWTLTGEKQTAAEVQAEPGRPRSLESEGRPPQREVDKATAELRVLVERMREESEVLRQTAAPPECSEGARGERA